MNTPNQVAEAMKKRRKRRMRREEGSNGKGKNLGSVTCGHLRVDGELGEQGSVYCLVWLRDEVWPSQEGMPQTERKWDVGYKQNCFGAHMARATLHPISAGHRLALLPLLWGPSQEAMAPPGSCTSRVLQLLECQRAMPWAGHQRQWRGFLLRNLGAAGTNEEVRIEGPLRGPARSIHGAMHAQEELSHLWGLGFSWCREKLWVREC